MQEGRSCPVTQGAKVVLVFVVLGFAVLPFGWFYWNALGDQRALRGLEKMHEATGDLAFSKGDYQAALTAYIRAKAVRGTLDVEHKIARARAELVAIRPDLLDQRVLADLEYECRWLLANEPSAKPTCTVVLGHIAAFNQNSDAAQKAYKEALQALPDHAGAHLGLALIAYRSGDAKTAQAEFEAVIKKFPEHLDSLIGLGDVHLAAGETEAAIDAYTKAVQTRDDPRARHGLGLAYARQNKIEAAVAELQKSISLNPQAFASYAALGNLLAAVGDLGRAEQAFRSALAIQQDTAVQVALASVLTRQGRPAEALQFIQAVLNAGSRDPGVLLEAARALEALGRKEEARGFYEATSNALREVGGAMDRTLVESFRKEVEAGLERTATERPVPKGR